MTGHPLRLLVVPALAVSAVGATSSCSTSPAGSDDSRPAAAQRPAIAEPAAEGRAIAQLQHGRQAHFALCVPPACPAVTPKTLAVNPPHAAAAVSRADGIPAADAAIARSPSPRETLVTAAARTPSAPSQRSAIKPEDTSAARVTDTTVTFPFGSAALTAAARASINVAAAVDGIRRIDIRGRTDNVGPAPANETLARQRAAAVAQYLRARHPHLAGAELHLDARGGCCYAAANDTPQGRARNRRVEVAFWRNPSDP